MTEIEIQLREIDDAPAAVRRIDQAIASHGLVTTLKGTLKSFPGSTHWHCKLGREKGTLEITLWPVQRRAWFKVQAARGAGWIDELLPKLKHTLET